MNVRLDSRRLRYQIARRGLSQREFARFCGLTETTLSRALNGRRVREGTLNRIALGLARAKPLPGDEFIVVPTATTEVSDAPSR